MIEYSYWGNPGEPPTHLKTTKQLAAIGLSPVKAVGRIETRKYTIFLYDPGDISSARPKRQPTPAQLEVLAKAREKQRREKLYREWWMGEGQFLHDRNNAIDWARGLFSRDDWVVLDTETTGLGDAEIVQIAIVNPKGEAVLDSLVKPTILIPEEVIEIHGITNEAVVNAPTFPEVYPKIKEAIANRLVIIYNAAFDTQVLRYCCKLHKLPRLKFESDCAMEWVSQFNGNWSNYYGNYRWVALHGDHSALGDCLTCLHQIQTLAEESLIDLDEQFEQILKPKS